MLADVRGLHALGLAHLLHADEVHDARDILLHALQTDEGVQILHQLVDIFLIARIDNLFLHQDGLRLHKLEVACVEDAVLLQKRLQHGDVLGHAVRFLLARTLLHRQNIFREQLVGVRKNLRVLVLVRIVADLLAGVRKDEILHGLRARRAVGAALHRKGTADRIYLVRAHL